MLLLFYFFHSAWVPALELKFRSQINLSQAPAVITLADVAEIADTVESRRQKLAGFQLSNWPRGKKQLLLSKAMILHKLRPLKKQLEAAHEELSLSIGEQILVDVTASPPIREVLHRRILEKARQECVDCQIKISQLSLPPLLQGKESDWQIQWPSPGQLLRAGANLRLTPSARPGAMPLFVNMSFKVMREVPVATRALEPSQPLSRGDVHLELRDVTNALDGVPQIGDLLQAKLNKYIGVRQQIWQRDLQREKAVNYGQPVQILAGGDNWQVTVTGTAQQSGYVGDFVRVLNPVNKKTLVAKIVRAGVVQTGVERP